MAQVWTELFGARNALGPWQECARAALIFLYGLVLVRVAGRRVFGKWSALDIVVSIVVGSNLSRALTGTAPLGGTLLATTLLMLLHWLLAMGAARWQGFSRFVEGHAVPLVHEGRLDEAERRFHAVSMADLQESLRQSGLERPEQAEKVALEPSGKITVLKGGG